jgi:hypothetical protein
MDGAFHLDIGEVGLNDAVHDAPYVGDGVLMLNPNLELVADEGSSALPTKQVLGFDRLFEGAVDVFQLNTYGIIRVLLLIGSEPLDGPGPLNLDAVFLEVANEDTLNMALVKESGKGVPGINETRAAGPGAGSDDALAVLGGIPEGDFVDTGRLVSHDGRFEPHIPEQIERARLDAVGPASGRRLGPVVNVLDLVTPSRQAG